MPGEQIQTVGLVPLRRVGWPAVGFYYEIEGHYKLCICVDLAQGWAAFWGPECRNEYHGLSTLGKLTEYALEPYHETVAA